MALKESLLIVRLTAYPRAIDFAKFGAIAKQAKALLVADISHIAGLVVAGAHASPFPYADIVTSTTHKTLAGPRSAFIICKTGLAKQIDMAIFPGLQGGPMDNVIAAKAICFTEAQSKVFKQKQKQTIINANILAQTLVNNKIKVVTDGTDNHLLLLDLRSLNIGGKKAADLLAEAEIYTNANMIPYDPATPFNPSGLRLGTAVYPRHKENK
jgi:glycine hydroxymethyltransferase